MAKNRRRKSPSTKGHPKPIAAWHVMLGVIIIVLMFVLWNFIRTNQ